MRKFAIFTAGAALVLGGLAIPGMAMANGRTASPQQSTTISAQSDSLDTPIVAQGKGHGKGHGHGRDGYRKGHRRGYRHGYSDSRHGYYRHGYHGGGSCYGCDGPGSRCDRYGCGYGGPAYGGPGYGGGYYGGGYGCGGYDPCSQPYQYDCTRYAGPDGRPAQDPQCQYDSRCDCYVHNSEQPKPADQPAPQQGTEPAPQPGEREQPRPY